MFYRADIDGLRAVAVLPVIAFHAGISAFSGGFVGVDVFFVISGYLISNRIMADLRDGNFEIRAFYERRIRRIFPALAAMLFCTSALSYMYLLPSELENFSKSLVAAALSLSNVFFWNDSGYFAASSETQPLLHTWSLAVEEQFYALFPLCLLLANRFSKGSLRITLTFLIALSFCASSVQAFLGQTGGFYLLHSRAWELLLGAVIAGGSIPSFRKGLFSQCSAVLGLGMIMGAVFVFSKDTPFPGMAALIPCIGAALIIHIGRTTDTLTSRLLRKPPLVFVGLISYSLYLWHWPLIVFQKNESILFSGLSSAASKALLVCICFVPAILSWWLIEKPFRSGPTSIFAGFGVTTGLVAAIGIAGWFENGFPDRFSPAEIEMASYLTYDPAPDYRAGVCFVMDNSDKVDESCLRSIEGRKNYILVGDSFAADLWTGLTNIFPDVNLMQATGAGCRPTLAQATSTDVRQRRCATLMNYIFSDYLLNTKVDAVLLAGSWREDEIASISSTLDWTAKRGIKVILFGPKIQYDAPLPRILVSAIQVGDKTLPDRHRPTSFEKLDKLLSAVAYSKQVKYISFFSLLCKEELCTHTDGLGRPMAFDTGHFTKFGSSLVAERLQQGLSGRGPLFP